jgi:HAD superfamily hydrolase (TIGR01509 family)
MTSSHCVSSPTEITARRSSATIGAAVTNARIPARAVLFDWDGTLLNSYDADARAYVKMFRALKISWDLEDLRRHYSPNWYRVYRAARLPRALWDEADRLWSLAYEKEKPILIPGARRTLRQLERRFTLALVTSGNRRRVRRQLRDFELAEFFAARVCCEDAPFRKPHPAPLRLALRRLRLPPEDCVYVGDAPEDVEMAHRAGVRAIAVLGPSPTRNTVHAALPDLLLEWITELPRRLVDAS